MTVADKQQRQQQGQQQQQQRAPGTKRLAVIASAVAYVVFLGVPVWWQTTSLHRPPLPHEAMQQVALEASSSTAFLPVTLQLVALLPPGSQHVTAADLYSSVHAAVAASSPAAAVRLSVTVTSTSGVCDQYPTAAAAAGGNGDSAGTACTVNWGAAAHLLSGSSSSSSSSIQGQQQLDQWLHQQQQQQQGGPGAGDAPGHYTLYLLAKQETAATTTDAAGQDSGSSKGTLVVGRYRHAWVTYSQAQSSQQQLQGLAAAASAQALSCCFVLHAGPQGLAAAGSLPISPSGHTHLSLSLLNADPEGGSHFTWDMEEWEAQYLTPISASLAPVTAVTAESQVLQYTAARLQGQWSDKHGAYVVKGSQLPFFIDSEWSLESGRAVTPHDSSSAGTAATAAAGDGRLSTTAAVGRDAAALVEPHVLQFVVYVPPQQHRPLQLLGRKGRIRDSNSYVIPSWGGLMVLNPDDSNSTEGGNGDSSNSSSVCPHGHCTGVSAVQLTQQQYQYTTSVVIAQLQTLFGVAPSDTDITSSSDSTQVRVQQLPAGRLGFSGWQIDALLRQRSAHDVREAARVLAALSTLVQELPNLEMPDLIGEQVAQALTDISCAWQYTAAGNFTAAAAAAKAAHAAAEAAFSHPAVLAQLNFPESHKLGVYMPLFLPLCVPLIQGLVGQLVYYRKQRQKYVQLLQASRTAD